MTLRRKNINFEKKFAELETLLDAIFSFSALNEISGMHMYQLVYDMCNAVPRPFTDKVFMGIAEYLDQHTTQVCQSILCHDDIVTAYAKAFERFEMASDDVSRSCYYLNRIISPKTNTASQAADPRFTQAYGKYKKQNVESLAMSLWKTNVLFYIRDCCQNRLFYQVFEMIRRDRDTNDTPHSTIKTVITSLVTTSGYSEPSLQIYIEEFERPYLVHTKRYYEAEAAREIASGSISQFMRRAVDRLQQEIMRNNSLVHSTSHQRVIKEFEAQYITAYKNRIVDEFEQMLQDERFEDCTLAYTLLHRLTDGLKPILSTYEDYISKLGRDIIAKLGATVLKNPKAYVDQLLALHQTYYQINQRVFSSDSSFTAAVDKAFRSVINGTMVNASSDGPETLARYCDMMMKKNAGKREVSTGKKPMRGNDGDDLDVEERLMKMITLFKYVDDKDVFQKFYSRMLAKRLIYSTSASEEMEANMISRLKEICGVEYTSKLNKMFMDISLSRDLNGSFRDYVKEQPVKLKAGFDILVLTAGAWPLNQKDDPEAQKTLLPPEMEQGVTLFESFYGTHHNGRRLLWQWNLVRGDVRLNYLERNYELQVGLHQMILLALFNQSMALTISELSSQSGLPQTDVSRSLKPLIDIQVLKCTHDINDTNSTVQVNPNFSSKRSKIKVTVAAQQETQQETQAARKSVEEDRRMYIQAAIVRIMKSRQMLPHVQLIQEIIDQANARFSPSVIMIKKCIEQLLEKQYIARQDRDTYVYVA
ncbi:Cullin-domain-containing protein [Hesseltinella vesiculosa]|uniref:Cullin-5 n=1 Tax=Hesseltinella vesiculosa TaxID=101127 RepID=A0A1X2G2I1_9FUNG|nr:Cullin-domain-containing protein [Hesseltinella vesiculosa]